MMKEIEASTVSDKDIMDWLKDYAVPRIKLMRALLALKQLAEPVVLHNKIPEFVMQTDEYAAFRKILNAMAKTDSLAWAFEPETKKDILLTGKFGTVMGFMPVYVKKDTTGVTCRATDETKE